ncbi:MAG: phage holin family protein [Actinomycetota bacterium]|nr:phage holin family protein [Actinomycetota bacterium]MDA3020328.1 phage holin family protein [Actinomycetota bacterium]
MAEETPQTGRSSARRESAGVSDVVDLVKEYAKQETLGPLKGAGRWLALGSAGATFLGLGLVLVLLGILRLLQTELSAFDGGFSWVPYLIVLVLCLGLAWIALSRVKKATLGKEPN